MTHFERDLIDKFSALGDEYKSRLLRYANELTILSNLPASVPPPEDPPPAPCCRSCSCTDPVPPPVASALDPEREEIIAAGKKMYAIANKAEIPKVYQMNIREIQYLYLLMNQDKDPFDAFCLAFDYGFVKGNRATRRGKVKAL